MFRPSRSTGRVPARPTACWVGPLEPRTMWNAAAPPAADPAPAGGPAPVYVAAAGPAVSGDETTGDESAGDAAAGDVALAEYGQRLVRFAGHRENYHLNQRVAGTTPSDPHGAWQLFAERVFQYDPATAYWKAYDLTGDERWRTVARQVTDRYVRDYINNPKMDSATAERPGLNRVKARTLFLEGLTRDWADARARGDADRARVLEGAVRTVLADGEFVQPLRGVGATAGYAMTAPGAGASTIDTVRIVSRVIEAYLDARKVLPAAPRPTLNDGGRPVDGMTAMVGQSLDHLEAFADETYDDLDPRVDPPYFWFAMASKAVLRFLREAGPEADPYRARAGAALRAAADKVWADAWVAADQAFAYSPDRVNDDGNPARTAANPGLNVMFAAWSAELYQLPGVGVAADRDRAVAAFAAGVRADLGAEADGPPLEDPDHYYDTDPATPRPSFSNEPKRWRQLGWWTPAPAVIASAPDGPRVTGAALGMNPHGAHVLSVAFDRDVAASLAAGAVPAGPGGEAVYLTVTRTSPGTGAPVYVSYQGPAGANTYTFAFSGRAARLPEGTYAGTFAAAVRDAGGRAIPAGQASFTFVVPPAAVVESVRVNDGGPQRSRVTGLTVTFAGSVALDPGAFRLSGRNGAGTGTTVTWSNPSGDVRTWVLAFAGAPVTGGSLADGVYDLTVVAARVRGDTATGTPMAADHAFAFHRLFADADGDRDVDGGDSRGFRGALGSELGTPAYNPIFDYDADGDVDGLDSRAFRQRLGTEI